MKAAAAVLALFAAFSFAFLRGEESPTPPEKSIAILQGQKPKPVTVPPMNFKHSTLPNGLEVYSVEDHSTPIVAVQVWYHVGSKDDPPGRSGFAHMFEHMMFKGNEHMSSDMFDNLTEYAILAVLLCRALRQRAQSGAFIIAALYAVLDEFHQSFVSSRTASAWDVAVDWVGAVVGVLLFGALMRRRNRKSRFEIRKSQSGPERI